MFRKNDGSPPIQMQATGFVIWTRDCHTSTGEQTENMFVSRCVLAAGCSKKWSFFHSRRMLSENWKLSKLIALLYIFLTYKINT